MFLKHFAKKPQEARRIFSPIDSQKNATISFKHVMCKWEGVALVLIRVFYPRHWLM